MEECQKGANLGLKCVRMRLAARLCPDPLGVLEHSPRPHSCNSGEGRLLLREREGNGKREGREEGKRRGERKGEGRTPVPDWESTKEATLVPHGITPCYLPSGRVDIPAFTPAQLILDLLTPEGCKAEFT